MVKEAAPSSRESSTRHTEIRDTALGHLQLGIVTVSRLATLDTWRERE